MATGTQSVEPQITELGNGWLKDYNIKYFLQQDAPNEAIKQAFLDYKSKSGGKGGNTPDVTLLLEDRSKTQFPVIIEYKGYKNKLVKLDENGYVANRNAKNEFNYNNIKAYAVNGAVHYANALLQYTEYKNIIAIGMTGYIDECGKLQHSIGVWLVSAKNLAAGQEIGKYNDLSFLSKENFDAFIDKINAMQLTPAELERIKEQREKELTISLVDLNNKIYKDEKVSESDRVYFVTASIFASLGIPGKVAPLKKNDLVSSSEAGETDGCKIYRKIRAFMQEKNLPKTKLEFVLRTFENKLTGDNLNRVVNGETQIKRIFSRTIDNLGLYYRIGLTTDFTGRLFNEMYSWLGWSQDKLNDVVLTPSYVATFLVKLARVNMNSYVWDFATGSAGLLVAAMNEMINEAQDTITDSPERLAQKIAHIKAEQLLGLEILPDIYMLAILNMILMGDGSSNILNEDSLKDFDGNLVDSDKKFPATAFVLNPPYSANGNGMVFVEKALSMMEGGYAAIIIQNSAGSGKATEYNKRILKRNTLLASIKMPIDLFIGKSSVQTNVYVFEVGKPHKKEDVVKFIDFSDDGYTRTNRKKASCNLKDTGNAKARYQEVVNLVQYGKGALCIFTEQEYFEGHIDPENGADWNQSAPKDTKPTIEDFKKTVSDYLAWEVSCILKQRGEEDDSLKK